MKNYSMYYSYKGIGDVLLIIFDNEKKATRHESIGRVTVIYHDDEIIGYNIFDIKEVVKIRNEGMIYLPTKEFVSIVNSILINAKQAPLDMIKNSGYFIGTIIEKKDFDKECYLLTINVGDEVVKACVNDSSLNVGDNIVVAKLGTRLNSGVSVKEEMINGETINGHVCTCLELGIKEEKDHILVLDKAEKNGIDFFSLVEE